VSARLLRDDSGSSQGGAPAGFFAAGAERWRFNGVVPGLSFDGFAAAGIDDGEAER
jgi:hypothetical protein